jgi:hypothetical protein
MSALSSLTRLQLDMMDNEGRQPLPASPPSAAEAAGALPAAQLTSLR